MTGNRIHFFKLGRLVRTVAACGAFVVALGTRATTVTPPTFPELVAEAQSIVRATVTSIESKWVTGPERPVIKTFVTFAVKKRLKGTPSDTLTLEFLGGTVGTDTLAVGGMPKFAIGRTEIIFVTRNGEQFCPLVRLAHGRYRVLDDAASQKTYVARDDGAPLEQTDDVQIPAAAGPMLRQFRRPEKALSPDAFETHIDGEVRRQRPPATP